MTLIKVDKIIKMSPLSRSYDKLVIINEIIANNKLTPEKLQNDFAYYIASVLRARVKESIYKQSLGRRPMKSLYKPLNKYYSKTKPKANQDKFWINTGYLVNNLKLWRSGNTVRIGFKNSDTYPSSSTKLVNVILWLEKGTKNIPARPLFSPHAKHISKHISQYFKHYIKMRYSISI